MFTSYQIDTFVCCILNGGKAQPFSVSLFYLPYLVSTVEELVFWFTPTLNFFFFLVFVIRFFNKGKIPFLQKLSHQNLILDMVGSRYLFSVCKACLSSSL